MNQILFWSKHQSSDLNELTPSPLSKLCHLHQRKNTLLYYSNAEVIPVVKRAVNASTTTNQISVASNSSNK